MKRLIWMLTALALPLGGVGQARAEFIIKFSQAGANVEADGTGTINLSGLTAIPSSQGGTGSMTAQLEPNSANVLLGYQNEMVSMYSGASGPSAFGTGLPPLPSSGPELGVGIEGLFGNVYVPDGYVSGTSISSSSTYDNTTISGLGLTPGTYTWTWGTGANADSLVVDIPSPATAAPEPASLTLLGIGAVCSLGYGWRRRR